VLRTKPTHPINNPTPIPILKIQTREPFTLVIQSIGHRHIRVDIPIVLENLQCRRNTFAMGTLSGEPNERQSSPSILDCQVASKLVILALELEEV
jgi:hypothetical protein